MDKVSLVEQDLEDAAGLVARLIERGLPVQMAAWVRRDQDARYMLLIASPNVQKFGPFATNQVLSDTLSASGSPIRLDDVRLTNTTDMPPPSRPSFSYVFPVSGLEEEIFIFHSPDKVRASAKARPAHAA